MSIVRRTLLGVAVALVAAIAGRGQTPTDLWQPTSGGAPPAPAGVIADPFGAQPADGSCGPPSGQPATPQGAAASPEDGIRQVSTSSRLKRLPKIGHMPLAHERISRTPAQ